MVVYIQIQKVFEFIFVKTEPELFSQGQNEQAIDLIETKSTILNEIWESDTGWKETVIFAATGDKKTLQSIEDNPLPFPPKLYSLLLIGQKNITLQMLDQQLNFSRDRAYVDPILDTVRTDPRLKKIVEEDLGREIDINHLQKFY